MAVKVLKDHIGNPVDSETVHARAGDKVKLTAVVPGTDPPQGVDGTWTREDQELPPAGTGKVELTAGRDIAGKLVFTSEAATPEKAEVTLTVVDEPDDSNFWARLWKGAGSVFLVLGAYTGLVFLFLYCPVPIWDESNQDRSFSIGVLTLAAMFFLAHVAGRVTNGKSGIPNLVKGTDQRASTSKIQYLLWTLLLGFVLAYVAAYAGLTGGATFACSDTTTVFCIPDDEDTWTPYLILLGVPAATAAVAKGIVSTKITNGTLQKTEAQQANLADVATNDAGNADLVDIQYLMFNLIAFVYVGAHFATKHTLPDVPDLLLGLTSAAAGTYVLNKSLLNNKPVITSVTPSSIRPGDVLTVKGENLLVEDSKGDVPDTLNAKIAGIAAVATRDGNDLSIRVPEGIATSSQIAPTVTVVTKANIETEGYPVSLVPLKVVGWAAATAAAGAPAADAEAWLTVTGLPKKDQLTPADRKTVQVSIGGMTASGEVVADNEVKFTVPTGVASGQVDVKVTFMGQTSDPVEKVPVA